MNPVTFTADQLKQYFSGSYWHPSHDEVSQMAAAIRVHADGTFPATLITARRPHESEAVQQYRETIWKAITKPYFGKVLNSLAKIRRSSEWSVKFDEKAIPNRIPEAETLEQYLMYNLPRFVSLTNWAFTILLREYNIDANAWVTVIPIDEPLQPSQYVRPQPIIFRSEQVVDFLEDTYLIVLADEKVSYVENDVTHIDGDCYYIITDAEYLRYDQIGSGRRFGLTWIYEHNIGELPACQMRGVVIRTTGSEIVNESRLAPMLPRLDEACREYSDLQAEVVQNIYTEKWEYGQDECATCAGSGHVTVAGFGNLSVACGTCKGSGFKPRGPFTTMLLKQPMAGEASAPTPPAGFLQKDTNIVELQDKRVDAHIFNALAAVNMEFLMQTPQAESGVAKAYDADETNNFAHSEAEDIVFIMDKVAYFTNELRYGIVIPDKEARKKMLPTIAVPERFDLFSAAMVEQELLNSKKNNLNPFITNAIELEYANRKFSTDPTVRDQLSLSLSLDPLPNIVEEDKVLMFQNGGVSKLTYIISCNIYSFIQRAIDEKGVAFANMDVKDQKKLMTEYAQEQIDDTSAAKQIMSGFTEAATPQVDPLTGKPFVTNPLLAPGGVPAPGGMPHAVPGASNAPAQ